MLISLGLLRNCCACAHDVFSVPKVSHLQNVPSSPVALVPQPHTDTCQAAPQHLELVGVGLPLPPHAELCTGTQKPTAPTAVRHGLTQHAQLHAEGRI